MLIRGGAVAGILMSYGECFPISSIKNLRVVAVAGNNGSSSGAHSVLHNIIERVTWPKRLFIAL